ncbi:MAG: CC0125/CC1285 family lipoprotein [Desulfobaccales bacterium]
MSQMKKMALYIVLLLLAGCATSYQSKSLMGGYSDTQLAPDVFRVYFKGNAYTSNERAQDLVLLRAAELSLQHGFKYFTIVDESSSTKVSSITTPGSAQTTGTVYGVGNYAQYSGTTTYTPSTTHFMFKPRTGLLIKCFTDKPDNVYTFDSAFVQESIKQKYDIK